MSSLRFAAVVAVLWAAAMPAAADDTGLMHDLLADLRARIDAAIAARPPTLVPPKKVDIKWRLAKVGTVDLGAPLVAMTGGDLDGDGRGELYAVTAREVIALAVRGKKLEEIGRVAFSGDRATPAPRDVVATAIVSGNTVIATVSTWTHSLHVHWQKKTLVADLGEPGFALCPGEVVQLATGRNFFGDPNTGNYGARCPQGLVEADGHPLRIRAELSIANKLAVSVERCNAPGIGCAALGHHEYNNVGTAFEIADVNRDGTPEAIFAAAGAPGDPDRLEVLSFDNDDKKFARLKKTFVAGGIAGVTTTDIDGDHVDDVVAAVRIIGASRIDLWRLE